MRQIERRLAFIVRLDRLALVTNLETILDSAMDGHLR